MDILNTVIENIDLMYIVSCNAASYMVIKLIEGLRKSKKKMRTGYKRLTATIVAILMGVTMYYKFDHEVEPLFYGAFIQFLTWDYLFKPIMKALPGFFLNQMGSYGGDLMDSEE